MPSEKSVRSEKTLREQNRVRKSSERESAKERAERTHLIGAIGDEQSCDRRGTNDVNEIAI